MAKVIQIRDVPDGVHEALVKAARAQGLSLARYVLRELETISSRADLVLRNTDIVHATQSAVDGRVERDAILSALHDGRRD